MSTFGRPQTERRDNADADVTSTRAIPLSRRCTDRRIRAATIAVFVVAALLRLVLATVNREQSDNHVSAIDIIAYENRIPEYDRDTGLVKEAFQPKLYH